MRLSLCLLSVVFSLSFSQTTKADFQWVEIFSGTYCGTGFDRDRNTALQECQDSMEQNFIALAQMCCESTETDTTARFGNRCAGGYSGPETNRSFDGGVAAYFCWPGYDEEYMEHTGYYLFNAHQRPYSCEELINTNTTPVPTPVENPIPVIDEDDMEGVYPEPSPSPAPEDTTLDEYPVESIHTDPNLEGYIEEDYSPTPEPIEVSITSDDGLIEIYNYDY